MNGPSMPAEQCVRPSTYHARWLRELFFFIGLLGVGVTSSILLGKSSVRLIIFTYPRRILSSNVSKLLSNMRLGQPAKNYTNTCSQTHTNIKRSLAVEFCVRCSFRKPFNLDSERFCCSCFYYCMPKRLFCIWGISSWYECGSYLDLCRFRQLKVSLWLEFVPYTFRKVNALWHTSCM